MEIIESVARALMRHHDIDPDVYVGMHGGYGDWLDAARLAIAAMREPTGSMCAAGEYDDCGPPDDNHYITARDAEGVWTRMIDAALATPTAPHSSPPTDEA